MAPGSVGLHRQTALDDTRHDENGGPVQGHSPRSVNSAHDGRSRGQTIPWADCDARQRAHVERRRDGCRVCSREQACEDRRDAHGRSGTWGRELFSGVRFHDSFSGSRLVHVARVHRRRSRSVAGRRCAFVEGGTSTRQGQPARIGCGGSPRDVATQRNPQMLRQVFVCSGCARAAPA